MRNDYARIFRVEIPTGIEERMRRSVLETINEEELNNIYNFYTKQWTEQAAEQAAEPRIRSTPSIEALGEEVEDIQAETANLLTQQLKEVNEPEKKLTLEEVRSLFASYQGDLLGAEYEQIANLLGQLEEEREQEKEAQNKKIEEDEIQVLQDVKEKDTLDLLSNILKDPELIGQQIKNLNKKVKKVKQKGLDTATLDLEIRLAKLAGKPVEKIIQQSVLDAEINEKYKLVDKLNANKDSKGTLIGNETSGFFVLTPTDANGYNKPNAETIEQIEKKLSYIERFINANKKIVEQMQRGFNYAGFIDPKNAKNQKTLISLYTIVLFLNEISGILNAEKFGLPIERLKKVKVNFDYLYDQTMRPLLDKIIALVFETAAMRSLQAKIIILNNQFKIKNLGQSI